MTTDYKKLGDDAEQIAVLIAKTPTEDRAVLYDLVSTHLSNRAQNHQAKLFRELRERG